MARPKDILVSTTSTIEGIKVIKHLKPVYANVVVGTNIFSDFFASFTDILGGYSNTYQGKLNKIYEDSVKKIQQSCYDIGGNCVLGLKIDIDEISGKGQSMFMISAVGTAVFAEIEPLNTNALKNFNKKVSIKQVNDLRYKNKVLKSVEDGNIDFNEETWEFITVNQMSEILLPILNYFSFDSKNYIDKLKIYIQNLPNDNKIEQLYSFLENTNDRNSALSVSLIMREFFLFDSEKTIELINSNEVQRKKIGLKIATFDKSHYDSNDIQGLIKLSKVIDTSFKELGEKTTKKKMLSSKEQEVWICKCDTTNVLKDTQNYCSSCQKDIYGFNLTELKPFEVVISLEDKISLIKELTK